MATVIAHSTWSSRRTAILQQACTIVAERVADGMLMGAAIRHAAKTFTNTDLGYGHRLRLSPKSLRRHYDNWKPTREASVLALKYNASERPQIDPILLRLVVEHCLQTGESLSQAVEALKQKGARISIKDLYRALNARAIDGISRSHRRLNKRRRELEKKFLQSLERANRTFLKAQTALLRRLLKEDLHLERRVLRQRDLLQKKFLQADARAVREREKLQRKALKHLL